MAGDYDFDISPLIWAGALIVLGAWGFWELFDWLVLEDCIKSSTRINPDVIITTKNGVSDTLFIYKKN